MMVGIWKIQKNIKPTTNTYFTTGGAYKGYGFLASTPMLIDPVKGNGKFKDYGIKCKVGDIIDMILNFDDLSLSFKINGTNYGKAFDIKQEKYRAAAYMNCRGDVIKLIQ